MEPCSCQASLLDAFTEQNANGERPSRPSQLCGQMKGRLLGGLLYVAYLRRLSIVINLQIDCQTRQFIRGSVTIMILSAETPNSLLILFTSLRQVEFRDT